MNKKGFTLVELLAVIVILAIIAVIATPLILNVIDNAKKGASENSALGYIEGIEKYIVLNEVTKENSFNFEKGLGYNVTDIKDYIEIKGDKPTEGWVCIGDKKEVTKAKLKINNYVIKYEDNKATVVDEEIGTMDCSAGMPTSGPTKELAPEGATYKAVVYLDPTDLTKECNASNSVSTTGTKEGCMKWYVYAEDNANYTMILDHNTTATSHLSSSDDLFSIINSSLSSDTSTWSSSLNPRLITANEVLKITDNTSFDLSYSSSNSDFTGYYFDSKTTTPSSTCTSGNTSGCKYGWLYDRTGIASVATYQCTTYGCLYDSDQSNYGYWTSTANGSYHAWAIDYKGSLSYDSSSNGSWIYGVRPVITISKVQIS